MSFNDGAFKGTEDAKLSPRREVLDKEVDDPLQKGKQTTHKEVGATSLPSSPRQTPKASMQNAKQKEAVREDKDNVDEEYIFKFIDNFVCKLMERRFEDVTQC